MKPFLLLRTLLPAICAAGSMSVSCNAGAAEPFPSKVVRIIIPATPGGGGDNVTRPIAQKLGAAWGQQVILDYRPGGGTVLGTALGAKAPPDGYTMVLVQTSFAINATLHKSLPFDPLKDFAPITQFISQAHLVSVHPSLPVKTVKQLIALAKARPGQLNYGSSYVGSGGHLAGELFKIVAGIDMVYVPYKGGAPAIADLLGGHLHLMFSTMLGAIPHMKAGRIRGIAVTTAARMPFLPDVPTIAESGVPGYESSTWNGVLVPAGTPRPIVTKLNDDLRQILHSADTRETIARDGGEAIGNTPEEFGAHIRFEIEKWAKVIRTKGIKDE